MTLQENLSNIMNVLRADRHQSIAEFADELGISRSSMQELLNGSCNPRMDTIEHLAAQLHLEPAALLNCSYTNQQLENALLLSQLFDLLSCCPSDKRLKFASLFQEMVLLMETEK